MSFKTAFSGSPLNHELSWWFLIGGTHVQLLVGGMNLVVDVLDHYRLVAVAPLQRLDQRAEDFADRGAARLWLAGEDYFVLRVGLRSATKRASIFTGPPASPLRIFSIAVS